MKIVGKNEEINMVDLIHKGNSFKFRCFTEPMPYMPRTDLNEPKIAEIVFTDLKEVDTMINMLGEFKKRCADYIGTWREVQI